MKIRELLSDESKWTKGQNARRETGTPVDSNDERAICWCLFGAVWKCYSDRPSMLLVFELISNELGSFHTDIVGWNDDPFRHFADVKALVERLDI